MRALRSPTPEPEPAPILIYGWPELAAKSMAVLLATEGLPARIASAAEVLACGPADIVVAPLPAMESLLAPNAKFRGRMILAVKRPEVDHSRAARLGATRLLAAPVEPRLLFRAISDCREELFQASQRDSSARA